MIQKSLVFSLFLSVLAGTTYCVDAPDTLQQTNQPAHITLNASQKGSVRDEFLKVALAQTGAIQSVIDVVIQTIAADKTYKKQYADAKDRLCQVSSHADSLAQNAFVDLNDDTIGLVLSLNRAFITYLEEALNRGLVALEPFDPMNVLSRGVKQCSLIELNALAEENDTRLAEINKKADKVGLSFANRVYRSAESLWRRYHGWTVMTKSLLYSALFAWTTFLLEPRDINEWAKKLGPVGTAWKQLKCFIGTRGKPATCHFEDPASIAAGDYYTQAALSQCPEKLSNEEMAKAIVKINNLRPTLYGGGSITKHMQIVWDGKNPKLAPYDGDDHGTLVPPVTISLVPKPGPSTGKFFLHTIYNKLYEIVTLPSDRMPADQLIKIMPFALSAKAVRHDAASVGTWIKDQCIKLHNYVRGSAAGDKVKTSYTDTPKDRFADVIGRPHAKAALRKVVDYIVEPERFDRTNSQVGRGFIFAGPPQTGKSLMARALAGEITSELERRGRGMKLKYFDVHASLIVRHGMDAILADAQNHAPCVLFIDEIDLLGLQRDRDRKLLSEFLTSMSGYLTRDSKNQVILLAATNKPENLDFALRQNGRFGKMLWFDLPSFTDRVEYFTKEFEKRFMNAARFDVQTLARETEDCSYGDLVEVFKGALSSAKIAGEQVSMHHFEHSIDEEVRHIIHDEHQLSNDEQRIVATYQAGAALTTLLSRPRRELSKVTILPITRNLDEEAVWMDTLPAEEKAKLQATKEKTAIEYGSLFCYSASASARNIITKNELIKRLDALLAGHIAEELCTGASSYSYRSKDNELALGMAKQIVFEGIKEAAVPKELKQQKLNAAFDLVNERKAAVRGQLEHHKDALVALINELVEHKTLNRKQVQAVTKL